MFLILILCASIAFYFYVKKCQNYWKDLGIKSAKLAPFFGTSLDFILGRSSFEKIHEDIYKSYPNEPYVGIYNFLVPVLFVRDPELIYKLAVKDFSNFHDRQKKPILAGRLNNSVVTLEGEEWKMVRNKLITTFSASKMKQMYGLIEECADLLMEEYFGSAAKTKKPLDVKEAMARFTLDVIGSCAFGIQFNSLKDSDSHYRRMAKLMSNTGLMNTIRLTSQFFQTRLFKWIGLKVTSDEVENFFFDLLHKAEESRKLDTKHRGDFLQLMLDIKYHEEDNKVKHLFTDDHIASNMFVFYFAGHETTANTLSFCLYELAMNPEIQEKLRGDIQKAKQANNGIIDFNTIQNIDYLEMVISETLRLHGPVSINGRICTETYQLPGSSFKLQPGDRLLYSLAALHKDEKYFPNPMKFDPERFSSEKIAERVPHVYAPFGDGPRICLGLRFAKLEMKICLISLLTRYRLSRCEKTEVPVIINNRSMLRTAKNGIWLSIAEIET